MKLKKWGICFLPLMVSGALVLTLTSCSKSTPEVVEFEATSENIENYLENHSTQILSQDINKWNNTGTASAGDYVDGTTGTITDLGIQFLNQNYTTQMLVNFVVDFYNFSTDIIRITGSNELSFIDNTNHIFYNFVYSKISNGMHWIIITNASGSTQTLFDDDVLFTKACYKIESEVHENYLSAVKVGSFQALGISSVDWAGIEFAYQLTN